MKAVREIKLRQHISECREAIAHAQAQLFAGKATIQSQANRIAWLERQVRLAEGWTRLALWVMLSCAVLAVLALAVPYLAPHAQRLWLWVWRAGP